MRSVMPCGRPQCRLCEQCYRMAVHGAHCVQCYRIAAHGAHCVNSTTEWQFMVPTVCSVLQNGSPRCPLCTVSQNGSPRCPLCEQCYRMEVHGTHCVLSATEWQSTVPTVRSAVEGQLSVGFPCLLFSDSVSSMKYFKSLVHLQIGLFV